MATKRFLLVFLALASIASAQVLGDTLTLQAQRPSGAQGISATSVGVQGNVNLYYVVATRQSALILPAGNALCVTQTGAANGGGYVVFSRF